MLAPTILRVDEVKDKIRTEFKEHHRLLEMYEQLNL